MRRLRDLTRRRIEQPQVVGQPPEAGPREFLTANTFAADLLSVLLDQPEIGTESDLNEYAVALVGAERYMPAAAAFGLLVVMAESHPRCAVYRRSLASTMEDLEWYGCSAYELRRARDEATSDDLRDGCGEQLERLAAITSEAGLDARLRELQLNWCLERIDHGDDDVEEVERLARLVRQSAEVTAGRAMTATVADRISSAAREHPGSAELLHGLLHCRLVLGDRDRAEDILARLDDLEPESSAVRGIAERLAAEVYSPPVPRTVADVWRLVALVGRGAAKLGDDGLRQAALADLKATSVRWPQDVNCAFSYAFGLLTAGDISELHAQLDRLETLERQEQTFHYNLTQLLAEAGEPERARHHLRIARKYATTETERAEVRELEDSYGWSEAAT